MPTGKNTSKRERIKSAVFRSAYDKLRPGNPKWFRKRKVSMNGKLRQAIIDGLPFDVNKDLADLILQAIFDSIIEITMRNGKATITHLGTFFKKEIKARRIGGGGNVTSNSKPRLLPARVELGFKPSTKLKYSLDDDATRLDEYHRSYERAYRNRL